MISFTDFQHFVSSVTPTVADIAKKHFRSDVNVIAKADASPVTVADTTIEAYLRAEIERLYPTHNIIGEEHGAKITESEFCWVLDPIDGTYSFIHGIPLFTTLIAFCVKGKPIYGAIYQPISDEIAVGDGKSAFYNGAPARLRKSTDLEGATLLTTSTTNIERLHSGDAFRDLALQGKCVRTWGDGYGYLMLVSGRADVMIDPKMKIWDSAALIPVVRGAGGVITDYCGNTAEEGDSIVASTNPVLHKKVIDALNSRINP